MCRNIRTLFNFDPPADDTEIRAASIQFVRKVSGATKPSKLNESAFEQAVKSWPLEKYIEDFETQLLSQK